MYEIRISLKIQYESFFQNMQINIIFNRNFSENLFFVSTHDVLTKHGSIYKEVADAPQVMKFMNQHTNES